MFPIKKNSYLQSQTGPSAKIINRCVSKAWTSLTQYSSDIVDINPDYNRLNSQLPCLPMVNADLTRRPLAYGNLQVRELRRELHSANEKYMLAALNSFCDILHDPELAYQAITLNVPDRLANLMEHDNAEVRERVCVALTILAGAADASMAIVHNPLILRSLKNVIDDVEGCVRYKAALLIERICLFWPAADTLMDRGFIEFLIDCVVKDAPEIVSVHFKTLESMFYAQRGRDIAYKCNFFKILVKYIKTANEVVLPGALKAIGHLLVIPEAKMLAIELELLKTLAKLAHHKNPAVHNAAAFAIMFATLKMRAKLQAFNYDDLPGRLVELAYSWQNEESQIYCIKALTNLCEYPPLRWKVNKAYMKKIEDIQVGNAEVKRYKDILLDIVSDISNLGQTIFIEDGSNEKRKKHQIH